MADDWADPDDWAAPAAPSQPSALGKAVEPITSYPETYMRMQREARSDIGRGVGQITQPENAWDVAKGVGNVALGSVGYVASPINAALRTVAGKPIEEATGIPKEYTEFAAGLALPGIGMTRMPAAAAQRAVPTTEAIKDAATAAYHAPEVAALKIRPEALSMFGQEVSHSLLRDGFDPLLAPKTHGLLEKATSVPDGTPFVTSDNVQTLRRMLGKAAGTADKTERAAALIAQRKLDDFMAALPENAVMQGDARAAASTLQEARANYAAASRSERLQDALIRADRQASRAGVGGNLENATRQRITEMLNSPAKRRGFSKQEVEALEGYVKGNFTRNILRTATKILGGDNPLMAAIHAGLAYPTSGASLAAPLTGYVFKKINNAISDRHLGRLDEMIRSRSPHAKAAERAVTDWSRAGMRLELDPSVANATRFAVSAKFLGDKLKGMGIEANPRELMSPFQMPSTGRADDDQQNIPRPPAEQKHGGEVGYDHRFAHGGIVRRDDGGEVGLDPFEAAALRTRQSVRPAGGRDEGVATRVMEELGGIPMQMAGNVKNLMDAAYTHEMGSSVRDNPQYAGLVADTAMNMVGMPALTGGVPASALGSAAKGIRAYHGSPHDFDRFDMSKIGTGEGAQAFGHGIYFAENPATAQSYRDRLSGGITEPIIRLNGDRLQRSNLGLHERVALSRIEEAFRNGHQDPVSAALQATRDSKLQRGAQNQIDILQNWKDRGLDVRAPGRMYEVDINAKPEQFLDWDRPLAGQSQTIQSIPQLQEAARTEAYNRAISATSQGRRDELFDMVKNPMTAPGGFAYEHLAPRERFGKRKEAATDLLRDAGIPGIKYLDQGSRGSGTGTSNYVVFDDKLISILRKYGLAGLSLLPPATAQFIADMYQEQAPQRANGGRVDATNIERNPTEAQKEAGNYAKDHVRIWGMDFTIENAKGSYRRGVDRGGKPWSVKMPCAYGYIKGTEGADGDHVDIYLGPHSKSPKVWVVDQVGAETKKFDEHKAFLGFASLDGVKRTYRAAFSDGKGDDRIGAIVEMPIETFKTWLAEYDTTKPMAKVANGSN